MVPRPCPARPPREEEGTSIIIARIVQHRGVQASAATGVTLAVLSTIADLPWPMWAAWGALSVTAVAQGAGS